MSLFGQSIDAWALVAAAVACVGAVIVIVGLVGDRSRGRRRCPRCWYSMQGVPGLLCPECGREAKSERRLLRSRRRWRLAAVGAVAVLGGAGTHAYRIASRDGAWHVAPFSVAVHVMPWYRDIPPKLRDRVTARLQAGPIPVWQREHLYARMARIIEAPSATPKTKFVALRVIESISWRGGYNGRLTGEAAGATSTLIGALDDAEPRVRRYALGLLGSVGGDAGPILDAVVPMIDTDPDPEVRMHAVGTVGQLAKAPEAARPEILERMKRAFARGDGTMKIWCIDAAGRLALSQPGAIAWLSELLGDSSEDVVRSACLALRKVGPAGASAAPALAHLAAADDGALVSVAVEAFKAVGDPHGAARSEFLGAVRKHVGAEDVYAAYASVYQASAGTVDELLEASAAWTLEQRAFAAAAACTAGADPKPFLPVFEGLIRSGARPKAQRGVEWSAVYKWALVGGCRDATLIEFVPALETPANAMEVWQASLRGRIAGDDGAAVRALTRVLAGRTPQAPSWTRAQAAEALGFFGEASRDALPHLNAMLEEEGWEPRERARKAIGRITGVTPPEKK